MAKPPNSITTPSLHDKWSKAKKAAEKAAGDLDKKKGDKKKTQAKAFALLAKKNFNKDLGPNLDKWVKLYPKYPEMKKLQTSSINSALVAYIKGTKASALEEDIQKPLVKTLKDIITEQGKRADTAETLIGSDLDLAIKESKKKIPPPIVVFKHPDIMRSVLPEAGTLKNIQVDGKLAVEVIIDDKEILAKYPTGSDYANYHLKITNAGDYGKLVKLIADSLKVVDKNVGKGKPLAAQEKVFLAVVDKAISDCVDRATEEAGRLGKLKGKARWAKVKRGGSLALSFAGAAAGVAGLALTPFTFGVSTVAGCLGVAKAGVEIGRQLADIVSTAEMMANGIAKDLNTLKKQYSEWLKKPEVKKAGGVSNKMGMAELAKSGINALAPTMITTLKSVKGDVGTYDEKINNLEVKANDLGDNLSDWLDKQVDADKAFEAIKKQGSDALSDLEFKILTKILGNIEKTRTKISGLIKDVIKLNVRVSTNRENSKDLASELKKISDKNPLWSDVGIAIFEVTSSVAFTLAGNVNAPDAYKFAKVTKDVISAVDITREQLQQTYDLAGKLKDSYEERKKRVRA